MADPNYTKMVDGAVVFMTAAEITARKAEEVANAPIVRQQPPLLAQLSSLDVHIPRGLEDYWSATAFDVTKLPAAAQAKLTQKQTLRAQLVALIASNTP